ncbi:MAG: polysaccharide deacetylase family protein [Gemmatimonadales bacterium]
MRPMLKTRRFAFPLLAFRSSALACGLLAAAVLGVSVILTRRNADAVTAPRVKRFSGSVVVQGLPSLLESPRLAQPVSVDILRDDESARFYDSPATLDSIIDTWRRALVASGADVRVVAPQNIGSRRARVLVIPSSPCLTIASRQAIESAADDGRGLIFTGLTGNRDIGCRLIGYGFIVTATGAARADVLGSRPMVYVAFPAGSPLADGIPPGARLELNPGQQVALRGSSRDAFYSDYSLMPAPADRQPLLDAAVSRSTLGRARVVYWGFELRDVASRPWSVEIARLLVRNSVEWAAGEPTATLEAWPKGRRAAAAIAQDVEDEFGNAAFALDSLNAAHIPGTYFLTTRLAMPYSRLSRALAAEGEAGSHTRNHWVLGGNPADAQRQRLAESQQDLTGILGHATRGLRPPEEQFDVSTLAAWAAEGGTYVFGANDQRSASPELLAVGADTVVLIGRFGSDDFAAVGQHRSDPRAALGVFLGDFEQTRALGGAYVLSYHSQVLARPEWVPVLAQAARAIASDTTVWCTTTGNIADWWRARAAVTARVDTSSRNRVLVTVHNTGPGAIKNLVVHVRDVTTRAPALSDARLLPAPAGELRLLVPSLMARATRTYTVAYAVPTAPQRRTRHASRRAPREHWSWRRLFPWLR